MALTEITSSYAKKPKPVLLETRTCEFYKTQCKWSFPTFMHGHVFVLMLLTPNQLPPSIIVGTRGELNSQLWNVTGKLTESKADICKSWASFVMRIRSLPRLVLSVSFSFWVGEGHFFLFCFLFILGGFRNAFRNAMKLSVKFGAEIVKSCFSFFFLQNNLVWVLKFHFYSNLKRFLWHY